VRQVLKCVPSVEYRRDLLTKGGNYLQGFKSLMILMRLWSHKIPCEKWNCKSFVASHLNGALQIRYGANTCKCQNIPVLVLKWLVNIKADNK